MKRIGEFPYLYRRGEGSFVVRLQVPPAERVRVGSRELKVSLGQDPVAAKKRYHGAVAALRAEIDGVGSVGAGCAHGHVPDQSLIDDAARAYFDDLRPRAGRDGPRITYEPDEGLDQVRSLISVASQSIVLQAYDTVALQARWLCDDKGWIAPDGSPEFRLVCERLLRARLEWLRLQQRVLAADFSERTDGDVLFAAQTRDHAVRTVDDLIAAYREERESSWSPSTLKNYEIALRALTEVVGGDTDVREISRDTCREVRSVLANLPPNYRKLPETRHLSLRDAAAKARQLDLPRVKPNTLNAYMTKFSSVLAFAVDEEWVLKNPALRLQTVDEVHAAEKRHPFNVEQLGKIFGAAPWQPRDESGGGRPARFWVPLLALYTGARLGELAQLNVDNVGQRDGYDVIVIASGEGRRVKNQRANRVIPIHPALTRMGFQEYVRRQRDCGQARLFPQEKPDKMGHFGRGVGDWFARLLDKIGLPSDKLTFHSFRHSFEDRLREVDLHETPIGDALTGRAGGGVSRNYGSAFSTEKLATAIQRIAYPGLDLSHLTDASVGESTDPPIG